MKQDRHGICDGCDRQKKLTLVHGRGLCVNCEALWGEAVKATEKRVLDDVVEVIDWANDNYDYDWSPSFMLEKVLERLVKKYDVQK